MRCVFASTTFGPDVGRSTRTPPSARARPTLRRGAAVASVFEFGIHIGASRVCVFLCVKSLRQPGEVGRRDGWKDADERWRIHSFRGC